MGQAFDAMLEFRQGHDTEEDPVLIDLGEPGDHAGVGRGLLPFRDDVGVEQKV